MTNAKRDNNSIPVILALSSANGATVSPIKIDPSTNALQVIDGSTGSDLSGHNAARDENEIITMIAVSSADGVTPIPIYNDSNGKLLIKSS